MRSRKSNEDFKEAKQVRIEEAEEALAIQKGVKKEEKEAVREAKQAERDLDDDTPDVSSNHRQEVSSQAIEWNASDAGGSSIWANQSGNDASTVSFHNGSNTYVVSVGTSASELNDLIANAEPGATFILEDGFHEFTETIVIDRSDITLSGESESGTVLNFTFPSGTGGNGIEVTAGDKTVVTNLQTEAIEGSSEITVSDASSFSVGDTIYISQPNTMEYLLQHDWDNVSFEDADARPFREFIVRIEAIDGDSITLSSPLPYEFDAVETYISHIDLLENIVLTNFTVTSGLIAEPNYYDFVNTFPEFENTAVIFIQGADGIELTMISILDAPSSAFDFRSTLELIADDLYINGAHNLGGGGNGYGINLYETFDASITGAEIYNVRHSVLFSSWNAETGNFIEVISTNRDINFHGSPDVGNEVVVLTSILDYDPSQNTGSTNGFWDIVSGGGSRHAETDIYEANIVVFNYAEGSQGSETIYGADGGAYIDGKGSQDVIIGGNGNDIIIGGTSRDTLTGGEGADLFAFSLGDSYDIITDFSGEADGDRIYLTGNPNLLSYDDLRIWQDGDDSYIRYGASSTIILSDYDAANLNPDYFIIDPYGNSDVLV